MTPNPTTQYGKKAALPEYCLTWDKNPSARKLLDVVIHILANEYIRTAKENPTLFSEQGGTK